MRGIYFASSMSAYGRKQPFMMINANDRYRCIAIIQYHIIRSFFTVNIDRAFFYLSFPLVLFWAGLFFAYNL
jgi:hypothetical protein